MRAVRDGGENVEGIREIWVEEIKFLRNVYVVRGKASMVRVTCVKGE